VLGLYWGFGKSQELSGMGATVQIRQHLARCPQGIMRLRVLARDHADADAPLTQGAFRKRCKP
jgi:hypothetical protein